MSMRKKLIRIWPVTLFALLIVCGITLAGVAFAKMYSSDVNKDSGVDVAEWSVSVDSDDDENVNVIAGDSTAQEYSFNVNNDSEVVSTYTVTVSGVPANVRVGIDGDDALHDPIAGVVEFTDAGELDAGETKVRTIRFVATLDATKSTNNSISIDVDFTQKEPRNE